MTMNKIEVLAPCGGFDSVVAAVRSGADAVYLGAKEFSARAGAQNFDFNELSQAVKYCHVRGVLVYLTINTIIFDSELDKAKDVILTAARADVDALIVQNMGVAMLAKKIAPDLPLHASTQMSVHSPSGARLLWELGFKRVVLSRELSREEIREIAESCPIELEVFVHGALCMSVSGQCYFSAILGSRSGNRGRCAQTCRLPFSVGKKGGYALSLKDNSVISHIRDMQSIGVTSAKIEGRLKRPEYVSAAVRACVQSRDEGFVDAKTQDELEGVFSRTGFTDGYYTGRRGYEMFGYRKREDVVSATPKLLSEIRNSYKDEMARVEITAKFIAKVGEKPSLTVTDGTNSATVTGDTECEKAINRPLDTEKCRAQLSKTGGTPYTINELEISLGDEVAMPLSALNELRRNALESLSEKRESRNNYKINDIKTEKFAPHRTSEQRTYARFTSTKIGSWFKTLDLCYVPLDSDVGEVQRLLKEGFKIGVEIPRALFSREEKVISKLEEMKSVGITDVLCNNLAAVQIAKEQGFKIHGGFGLNFTNTLDLLWAEEFGFADCELSFELSFEQINALGGALPRGVISYGYLPLMLTRNCPKKSANMSCKDCKGNPKMQDRMDKSFILSCDRYATEVLNTVPLDVLDDVENIKGIDFHILRFSVENSVENVEKRADFSNYSLKNNKKTHGLYFRGVL
ncbi:MAG: U32 family peptidase [Ruminococcus sp.]|nr:U32 family peptidase [Ruminococcus sp.]